MALQARIRAEILRDKYNQDDARLDRCFELGDLILAPISRAEARRLTVIAGGIKLVPNWSVPCRVIRVLSQGKAAMIKNMLTGGIKQIHLQHARFIAPPLGEKQLKEWELVCDQYLKDTQSAFDENARNLMLQRFFEPLNKRQRDGDALEGAAELDKSSKARRLSHLFSGTGTIGAAEDSGEKTGIG